MTVTKAVILAAGQGKRLTPITSTRPKHLIPIAGKPILQYTIESLKSIGITEILLIVGYKKEQIMSYFKNGTDMGVHISYREQKKFLGTAHATKLAKNFVANDSFLLLNGDVIMDFQIYKKVIERAKNENNIIIGKRVENPQKYGVIVCNKDGYMEKIVEKPSDNSFGNLINAGVYQFTSKIFNAIEETKLSARKEYELTDSLDIFIKTNQKICAIDVSEYYWNDIGRPWDILDANKFFLEKIPSNILGTVEDGVTIKGNVYVGKGTVIKAGTYIEGPVYIGENCIIGPNSYIRPYTSLVKDVRIGNSSEIKNTVVLSRTHISHLSYVGDSIIGENVNFGAGTIVSNVRLDKGEISMKINGNPVKTGLNKLGAVIGDNVQLGIQSMIMVGKKIGENASIGPGTLVNEDVPENTNYFVRLKCTDGIKKE
ncbi:MAG: glucose-1-phosphate thymidylyltransferase [Promethearchaeota archaeon]|nr:MAG: glucose-1-phosphate thymidylyltransferase [Candidatus Lokiarchaeota archaeon]